MLDTDGRDVKDTRAKEEGVDGIKETSLKEKKVENAEREENDQRWMKTRERREGCVGKREEGVDDGIKETIVV